MKKTESIRTALYPEGQAEKAGHKNIEICHVTKTYKNGAKALDDVSFDVGSGVFGLLGHNGAGKTTLMKAIVTILRHTKRAGLRVRYRKTGGGGSDTDRLSAPGACHVSCADRA